MAKYSGTGKITSADYKTVKWVGKSKAGKAVTITLDDAINMGNIDWTLAEKDDVVPSVEFTATYGNTDNTATDATEPWSVEVEGTETGAGEVLLGIGIFYIGEAAVALTRGGGKFTVEREYREINADGDRGPVKDRILLEKSVAKLSMNVLSMLTKLTDMYPALGTVTG